MFRSISEADLVALVNQAKRRCILVTPGVSSSLSGALVASLKRCSLWMVVVDGDEESCRLGYGDVHALKSLHEAASLAARPLRTQAGVRLGLLVSDDQVLVWTPGPLMFEAPRAGGEPNGMMLTEATIQELPDAVGSALGTATLRAEDLAVTAKNIEASPPAPMDFSRLAVVFSSRFQFVEPTLRGAELIRREISLDNLVLNADAPESLRNLLNTKIQPFGQDADLRISVPVIIAGELAYRSNGQPHTREMNQAELRGCWTEIMRKYLLDIAGFGKIIRHKDKGKFEQEKSSFEQVLRAWVEGFRKQVESNHEGRVGQIVGLVVARMAIAPLANRLTRVELDELVRTGLERLRVIEPQVKVVYKNITADSTRDPEFLGAMKRVVPPEELKDWFEIFEAARAVPLTQIRRVEQK